MVLTFNHQTAVTHAEKVQDLAIARTPFSTGFRLHKQLRSLIQAHALYSGRSKAKMEDFEEVRRLSKFMNLDLPDLASTTSAIIMIATSGQRWGITSWRFVIPQLQPFRATTAIVDQGPHIVHSMTALRSNLVELLRQTLDRICFLRDHPVLRCFIIQRYTPMYTPLCTPPS